jgi:hypothetical protein
MGRSKASRRRRTPDIAIASAHLSGGGTESHYRDWKVIVDRAQADGPWSDGDPDLSPAQRLVLRAWRLANRAVASLDAWERSVPWATDDRVIADCRAHYDLVRESAAALRARATADPSNIVDLHYFRQMRRRPSGARPVH